MSEFQVGASALEGGAMHKTTALRYLDELFRYAMVLTRNKTDAEDLVQETYVRGLKAIGSLQPDSNLKSWLFTILRNAWLNQLRQVRAAPRIHSWLPHRALNGSNGWTHSLEARKFVGGSAICGLHILRWRYKRWIGKGSSSLR